MQTPVLIKSLPSAGIKAIKAETFWGNIVVVGHDSDELLVEMYSRLLG